MTLAEATTKYPALMCYIADRNSAQTSKEWCAQLRLDEETARCGGLSEVAEQMKQAQADYGSYPYNSAMGEFLGLPIKPGNGEPEHGYYMASGVMKHYMLGVAQRRAAALIADGKAVRFVLARNKKTGQPIRFATFQGEAQIMVAGRNVELSNGRRKVTLSSNWSVETCLVGLVQHLETGEPYGGSN
jgi:hypothetical protein